MIYLKLPSALFFSQLFHMACVVMTDTVLTYGMFHCYMHVNLNPRTDPPENVQVTPVSDSYGPGDKITCSASGRPDPDYRWINRRDHSTQAGAELTITEEMGEGSHTYACEAFNSIRGQVYHAASQDISFTVTSKCFYVVGIFFARKEARYKAKF